MTTTGGGHPDDRGVPEPTRGPQAASRMTDNRQRAAEVIATWTTEGPWSALVDRIAAALDAAEARGRAEVAGRVRELADSYGRWPFRVDPISVTRKLDALVDEADPS